MLDFFITLVFRVMVFFAGIGAKLVITHARFTKRWIDSGTDVTIFFYGNHLVCCTDNPNLLGLSIEDDRHQDY